jgi:hypothetical protein
MFELTLMRTGREKESWERLSYSLATSASIAGAKNVKIQDFSKFKTAAPAFTTENLTALKGKMI